MDKPAHFFRTASLPSEGLRQLPTPQSYACATSHTIIPMTEPHTSHPPCSASLDSSLYQTEACIISSLASTAAVKTAFTLPSHIPALCTTYQLIPANHSTKHTVRAQYL